LQPRPGVPNTYLYATCANDDRFYEQLLGHATGTTGSRQRVKPSEVLRCSMMVPDASASTEWDRVTRRLYDLAASLSAESQHLAAVLNLLAPKLIAGELRVTDTKDAAEMIDSVAAR